MKITPLAIPEVLLVEPQVFGDERGFFVETWNLDAYASAGVSLGFVQDNLSKSRRGTLRGLHLQHPNAQGKLVRCSYGAVYDVAVDVRVGSPWFSRWVGARLDGQDHRQLWIPPGFAHGFLTLSDEALFAYKCTAKYAPECELTIAWDDPRIAVDWAVDDPILSEKDRRGRPLSQMDTALLPKYLDRTVD